MILSLFLCFLHFVEIFGFSYDRQLQITDNLPIAQLPRAASSSPKQVRLPRYLISSTTPLACLREEIGKKSSYPPSSPGTCLEWAGVPEAYTLYQNNRVSADHLLLSNSTPSRY